MRFRPSKKGEVKLENQNKKSLKWLWIAIGIAVVVALGVWCAVMARKENGLENVFGIKHFEFAANEKFATIKKGKGVAFAIPLSSVIGVNLYQFLSNNRLGRGN